MTVPRPHTVSVRCYSGTSYEARLRTRTRHGTSHYSDTWQFRTWSPWTPAPPPVTLVSLPRTQDTAGHGDTQQHRTSNKGKLTTLLY